MRLPHGILWSAVRGERERLRHEPVREQRDLCRQGRRLRVQVLVPDFLIVDCGFYTDVHSFLKLQEIL